MYNTFTNIDTKQSHIHERGCNRMRFYRILVAAPLKYNKHQEN